MDNDTWALILVDIQQGLDDPYWGPRNNPDAEANAARVLEAWRGAGLPIVHVHHRSVRPQSPLYPGKPGVEVKPEVAPVEGETVFIKTVNSAFIGTPLEEWFKEHGIGKVAVMGLTTNHCVSTTVRMAANLGFDTVLIGDACAANAATGPDGQEWDAETVHAVSLASLHNEFATVMTADDVIKSVGTILAAR